MKKVLIFWILLAFTSPAYALTAYKWVDKKGTVHFSDTPPSPTLNQGKELPKENGIEVLKKLETGKQPKGPASAGKSIRIGYTQGSGSSSGGGSTTVRSGRS